MIHQQVHLFEGAEIRFTDDLFQDEFVGFGPPGKRDSSSFSFDPK